MLGARRPGLDTCISITIDGAQDVGHEVGILPMRRIERVVRVDGQALDQQLAGAGRSLFEIREVWPRRFWVDVVRRHRRDTAPVAYSSGDQASTVVRAEVWRRLDMHFWAEDDPGDRD